MVRREAIASIDPAAPQGVAGHGLNGADAYLIGPVAKNILPPWFPSYH